VGHWATRPLGLPTDRGHDHRSGTHRWHDFHFVIFILQRFRRSVSSSSHSRTGISSEIIRCFGHTFNAVANIFSSPHAMNLYQCCTDVVPMQTVRRASRTRLAYNGPWSVCVSAQPNFYGSCGTRFLPLGVTSARSQRSNLRLSIQS